VDIRPLDRVVGRQRLSRLDVERLDERAVELKRPMDELDRVHS
jgi:hypothetical protein